VKSFVRKFLRGLIVGGLASAIWLYMGFFESPWSAVIFATIVALLGAIIARYRENRVSEDPPTLDNEIVIRDGRADYNGMSGWLYITSRRILFEGYPTDEKSPEVATLFDHFPSDADCAHQVSIPVLLVSKLMSHPLTIDSRLDLVLSDGRKLAFSVENPLEWADDISTARQLFLDEPRSEASKLFP
jgi:hypothetical protein